MVSNVYQTFNGGQLITNPLLINTGHGISNCNTIAIAAQSRNTCNTLIARDSVVIPHKQNQIFDPSLLPNVFVYSSQINNHFYINADGYNYGHLDIFNSWGSLIYSSNFSLLTTAATIWDGYCNTGICNPNVPLSASTYYYILDLYDCNLNQTTYGPIFLTIMTSMAFAMFFSCTPKKECTDCKMHRSKLYFTPPGPLILYADSALGDFCKQEIDSVEALDYY